MIQIFVYGKTHKGNIDLAPGSILNMEIFTELFDEEFTLGAYSLPVTAAMTDNNKKIFGFIEMLNTIPDNEQTFWRCDILNDGVPEMMNAKLTLLDYSTDFNYSAGTYTFTVSGNKGMFGSLIGTKTLRDIALPAITYPGMSSRQFATAVMKKQAGYEKYTYMRFAPVGILNFFDDTRPDYNHEFLAEDLVNDIVLYGSGIDDWEFGRPQSADTSLAATSGTPEYVDYRTIPFFTYKWVLTKLFAQFGYTIKGEWMLDAAWDDTVLFNNFAIEKYDTGSNTDLAHEITPARHLPKKLISEFLRDLQMLFNLNFSFLDGQTVSMDYRKTSLRIIQPVDATNIAGKLFSATISDYKEKGFALEFSFDSADNLISERVKEIIPSKLVATINKFTDIGTLAIGRPFEFEDIVFVKAENQYMIYANGVGINAWEYFGENLLPYNIGSGENKYTTGVTPMITHIVYNDTSDKLENKDRVACDMAGSYFSKRFSLIEADYDTRIFFIKMVDKGGQNLPSSFSNNKDTAGNKRVPCSLAWHGEDGLYQYCWKEWLEFLSNTRAVKTTLALNAKTYKQIKETNKIRINSTTYLITGMQPNIPLREPVAVDLFRM